ncbi:IclR family transcriptional regulator [Sphingobium herbicidovorans]|nr:IclR family transcriptional regulator C-terminal domain-containing protein [Sphingobium herbicidovorans]
MGARTSVENKGEAQENASAPSSRAISATIAILRLLAGEDQSVGAKAIADRLGLPTSTCFKVLKLLAAEELVDFNPITKGYVLGGGTVSLARRALDPMNAFALMRDELERIAHDRGASVTLWRAMPRCRAMMVGAAEASMHVRVHFPIGQRIPLFVGAMGIAFAAYTDIALDELREEFSRIRWHVAPSFSDYRAGIEHVRRHGFSVDRENYAKGMFTVGVPIGNRIGHMRYVLSGTMVYSDRVEEDAKLVARDLLDVAQRFAAHLG